MIITTSLSGSNNTLEIVPDRYNTGGPEAVLAIAATGGKGYPVRLSVTVKALAQAFNEIGYALTDRATAENISAKVAELQRDSEHAEITLAAIESLTSAWETDETMTDAAHAIQRILHPEPPYEFPHGTGAVIEAANRDGNSYPTQFVWVGGQWHHHGGRKAYTEDVLKSKYHQFKTLTEGVRT